MSLSAVKWGFVGHQSDETNSWTGTRALAPQQRGFRFQKLHVTGHIVSRDVCTCIAYPGISMAINLYLLISILYIWITTVARSNLKPRKVVIACIMIPENLVFGRGRTTGRDFWKFNDIPVVPCQRKGGHDILLHCKFRWSYANIWYLQLSRYLQLSSGKIHKKKYHHNNI